MRSRLATTGRALAATALLTGFVGQAGATEARATAADPAQAAEAGQRTARILAIAADPAYGAYLGGECVTCHQQSGNASGIPPIRGLPAEYTVRALVEYKLGIRANEVMKLMTARLADEEIAALAAHFASPAAD